MERNAYLFLFCWHPNCLLPNLYLFKTNAETKRFQFCLSLCIRIRFTFRICHQQKGRCLYTKSFAFLLKKKEIAANFCKKCRNCGSCSFSTFNRFNFFVSISLQHLFKTNNKYGLSHFNPKKSRYCVCFWIDLFF